MKRGAVLAAVFSMAAFSACEGPGEPVKPEPGPLMCVPVPVAPPSPPAPEVFKPCPDDMVFVEGDYCPKLIETCKTFLEPKSYDVCREFNKFSVCKSPADEMKHLSFCIDKYEYSDDPVQRLPKVMVSFNDMNAICEGQGKRLCMDVEWTKACEGPENKPYPYGSGYVRDSDICYQDKPVLPYDLQKIQAGDRKEFEKFDIRTPIDAYPGCVSDYGVVNMPGGVDEWVRHSSPYPQISDLKGGHASGITRARCRPETAEHGPFFKEHLIGGRCCAEPRKP